MQIQHAFALFQKGALAEAAGACEQILARQPDDFAAVHLLGLIAYQRGDLVKAHDLMSKALAVRPNEALALNNFSTILVDMARYGEALRRAEQSLALKPGAAGAHNNRGNALRGLGHLEEALGSYDQAIALNANLADAYNNRGLVLGALGRDGEALENYDKALALNPSLAKAHNNRAVLLEKRNDFEGALENWEKAVVLAPRNGDFHNGRAGALRELKRYGEALSAFDIAVTLKPELAEAHNNRGITLSDLGRYGEAVDSFACALALKPGFAEAYNSRAAALHGLGQHAEALASYEKAVALKPDYTDAQMNLGITYLQMGLLEKGWKKYEWRWKNTRLPIPRRHFPQPQWTGAEDLVGKTILLYNEQGLGDAIHFCRYAKLAVARGARVILEVPRPLARFLAQTEGVHQIVVSGDSLPDFDLHCPLASLPFAFNTSLADVPASPVYLAADPVLAAQWGVRLGKRTRPRIGLTWSGNRHQKNDHNRSMDLAQLLTALPPGLDYISLQKELKDADRTTLAARPDIRRFEDELTDFAETAALCANLDTVISVCTSTAHLAGALGKPTWIMLCFNPCWRWLLERRDTPWYPSGRLYRQAASGDWSNVLAEVRADLLRLA